MDKVAVNYVETITELANINGHIDFIDKLLKSHKWADNRDGYYYDQLDLIRRKQMDTNMYMAVVGEFSTGKSSFINAIIRDDLLKTDVLQSTTSAATVIRKGEILDVRVSYNDGTVDEYRKNISLGKKFWRSIFKPKDAKIKEELREYIRLVTADESVAASLKAVTIEHPSEILDKGLIIIDTPGTNVENERHEAVTAEVIRNTADAAIIVIPSDKQLPKSLLDFIKGNLEDVISRCIFVVNKMDLLREKEHKRVLQYIETRLKAEFGTEKANVFPYTPLAVLKSGIPETEFRCEGEYYNVLLQQSLDTEQKIYETLKEQRIIIQLQKLVVLIRYLFKDLETDLESMELSYMQRHEALERNKIKDLAAFIEAQKLQHKHALYNECYPVKADLAVLVDKSRDALLSAIHQRIYGAANHSELNNFIKSKKQLEQYINFAHEGLRQQLPALLHLYNKAAWHELQNFENQFKQLYVNLATLGGSVAVCEVAVTNTTTGMMRSYVGDKLTDIKGAVNSDLGKIAGASVGGVAAGAAIGSVIFPGVGTVIGGALGSLAGFLFRRPLEELKNEYFSNIKNSIMDSYNKLQISIAEVSDNMMKDVTIELFKIMDRYFSQYNALVRQMIQRDEDEKRQLERWSVQIKSELSELKNRQTSIESVKNKIV